MQDITPIIPKNKKQIETYGDGAFRISGEKFDSSIFLTTEKVFSLNATQISELTENSFTEFKSEISQIEILLVGTGEKSDFLNPTLEKFFRSQKIIIEYMNTGAACRTYNILLSEGREVAAILIAI